MKSFAELSNLPKASAFLNAWTEAFADVLEKVASAKHPAELLASESIEPDALAAADKGLCIIFTAGSDRCGASRPVSFPSRTRNSWRNC